MDPNTALASLRATFSDESVNYLSKDEYLQLVENASLAFAALDGWLSKGGFLPDSWQANREVHFFGNTKVR